MQRCCCSVQRMSLIFSAPSMACALEQAAQQPQLPASLGRVICGSAQVAQVRCLKVALEQAAQQLELV